MKKAFFKLDGICIFSFLLMLFFTSCSKQRFAVTPNGMVIQKRFDIAAGNNQGIAYSNGRVFVGYDLDGNNDKIDIYNYGTGAKLKEVNGLTLGHSADMKYNTRDHLLYVVNGGTRPTDVYTVNIEASSPKVQRNYDLKLLGTAGLIALDEANNRFFIISSKDKGNTDNHTITPVDIATGIPDMAHQFTIPYSALPYVPQGAAYKDGKIYFLLGTSSTVLAIIDTNTKSLVTKMITPYTPEPEGLDLIDTGKESKFIIGYHAKGIFDLICPQY